MEVIDILQNKLAENKLWYKEYIKIRNDYEHKANKVMKEINKLEKEIERYKEYEEMGVNDG